MWGVCVWENAIVVASQIAACAARCADCKTCVRNLGRSKTSSSVLVTLGDLTLTSSSHQQQQKNEVSHQNKMAVLAEDSDSLQPDLLHILYPTHHPPVRRPQALSLDRLSPPCLLFAWVSLFLTLRTHESPFAHYNRTRSRRWAGIKWLSPGFDAIPRSDPLKFPPPLAFRTTSSRSCRWTGARQLSRLPVHHRTFGPPVAMYTCCSARRRSQPPEGARPVSLSAHADALLRSSLCSNQTALCSTRGRS